ncbi:MAG: 3-dehydroquinate synthase [Pseudomonadota bacterium]|nr:3-dehydroquinate synthase [Pseudomonadota bacterium]
MHKVNVNLGDQSYPILIGSNLLGDSSLINPYLGKGKLVVVTNEVVAPLYLEAVKSMLGGRCVGEIILPDGEQHKNLEVISEIYDYLLRNKFDRHTTLLALGGGVIGDITGFAAATYQRGIGYIQIPTTLLAHVDSSVGGKTGVNHSLGKNMIGAFYQPRCVLADIRLLDSLPEREIKAGLAEVVKYGLIRNAKFFDWLAENSKPISGLDDAYLVRAIKTCCEMKADIVAQDEKEVGIRALLNLGHTFGHAIETAAGYGTWLHGETVAMGIVMAADLSRRLGWLDVSSAQRVRTVLEKNFGMPVVPPADISVDQYLDLMSSDKKVEQGEIRFILLKDIGSAVVEGNIAIETLRSTLTAGHGLCGEL